MARMILAVVLAGIMVMCLMGCKKSPKEGGKTAADYEAQAKKEINKDNMDAELERISNALEQEISREE